jgi:outer membrane receptor protein involved in Fe transport
VDHETGRPLTGAAVSLASGPGGTSGLGTRVANAEGLFLFRNVPPGAYRLSVTLIGYRDLRDTLQVDPESDLELILPMSVSPVQLEPLVVVAERPRGAMRDFEQRRRTRAGTFITREQIEARNALRVTDLLRMVPGSRIAPTSPYDETILLRGGCRPDLWIDHVRVSPGLGINSIISPLDVEAIEVYRGGELPVEFGSNSCGAVVVWTRVGERGPPRPGFWRRLAIASALLLLGVILAR